MVEIIIICGLAFVMGEVYSRTKRPKLYAFFNTAAGAGGLIISQFLMNDEILINNYNGAVSAILGVPGAILCVLLQLGG